MRSTFSNVFLALVAGASIATAGPVVTIRENPTINLDFAIQVNRSGMRVADFDRMRIDSKLSNFKRLSERSDEHSHLRHRRGNLGSMEASGTGVSFVTTVGFGTPPTDYSLLIDTSSSNTWVGVNKVYNATCTTVDLHQNITVTYGSGQHTGKEYNDTVTLTPDLVIKQQTIGVVMPNGEGWYDGVLGLGPRDLTQSTVTGMSEVRTVSDNLYSQGKISTEVFGVYFSPKTNTSDQKGVLTFGGADKSKYKGKITYTPITKAYLASRYWGIDQSITYGKKKTSVLKKTDGIVDTAAALLYISREPFAKYLKLTNAKVDNTTGLLKISKADYEKMESLYLEIGGTTFELTKEAQRFPQAYLPLVRGDQNQIYLAIGNLGNRSGQGVYFINGLPFLERFYSVYDETHKRIGFAETSNTYAAV